MKHKYKTEFISLRLEDLILNVIQQCDKNHSFAFEHTISAGNDSSRLQLIGFTLSETNFGYCERSRQIFE